jgi:hypothetical protein
MRIRQTEGRGRLYGNILDTVGDTPCIRINRIAPEHVTVYVKAEAFNPAASVKDRLATNIIEAAERDGRLRPGQTVVEASSGNTGIGLAMVCAAKGYPLVVTMVETFSIERRKLMRFLGARVVLTPKAEKGLGMYRKARELAEANGWFLARQFESADNADIHEHTTAREILADFRRPAAGLLGHRLRHRRYGDRRDAGPPARAAGGEDRPQRARRRRDRRFRACPGPGRTGVTGGEPPGFPAAPDPGLDAGFRAAGAAGDPGQAFLRPAAAGRRRRRHRLVPAPCSARRVSSPASPVAPPLPPRWTSPPARPRARCCWSCSPIPASVTCPPAVRGDCGRDERRRTGAGRLSRTQPDAQAEPERPHLPDGASDHKEL